MLFPYQDKDSRIHRLDARPKMLFVLSIFLLSILISDIIYLIIFFALVMVIVAVSKVMRATLSLLKYTVYVAAFIIIFSILFTGGSHVILDLGIIKIKSESVLYATSMCLRLFLAIAAFALMTFTIHPDQMLRILSKFGFKSMTGLSIATRMYPTIAADSTAISDAMKARGVEFDEGGVLQKARARAPVMMPLLLNSMERSMEIAEAMEARGFGAGSRTHYHDEGMSRREKAMCAFFLAALPFGVAMFIFGYGNVNYLAGSPLTITPIGLLVALIEAAFFAPILVGAGK